MLVKSFFDMGATSCSLTRSAAAGGAAQPRRVPRLIVRSGAGARTSWSWTGSIRIMDQPHRAVVQTPGEPLHEVESVIGRVV